MTNVDSVEVSRFEDLASQWWDPEGDFKPLHQINPLRLEYIDQRFPLDGQNMLDLGCGGGLLAESMSDRGASVMGLDAGSAPSPSQNFMPTKPAERSVTNRALLKSY